MSSLRKHFNNITIDNSNQSPFNYQYYQSPVGELLLMEQGGKLVRVGFASHDKSTDQDLIPETNLVEQNSNVLRETKKQLDEYFSGTRHQFDLPLNPAGTAFQKKAWEVLRKIPYGNTRTYGEQAELLGNKKYARAVGLANHNNPIAIIVPCHRVIGKNGKLTGYASGVDKKAWLLDWEQNNS